MITTGNTQRFSFKASYEHTFLKGQKIYIHISGPIPVNPGSEL